MGQRPGCFWNRSVHCRLYRGNSGFLSGFTHDLGDRCRAWAGLGNCGRLVECDDRGRPFISNRSLSGALARGAVEKHAQKNETIKASDAAIGQQGWKIVGLLRLSPLIPFNLSNYFFGLTQIGFWPYILASWIGMLPGPFLYVYLGHVGKATLSGGHQRTAQEKFPWASAWPPQLPSPFTLRISPEKR